MSREEPHGRLAGAPEAGEKREGWKERPGHSVACRGSRQAGLERVFMQCLGALDSRAWGLSSHRVGKMQEGPSQQ